MDAIRTYGISKTYRDKQVLDGVSITVREGDIYGLVGSNGAGKTTLMRIILGIAAPTDGKVEIFESGNLSDERRKVGALVEAPAINKRMTAFENMKVAAEALGVHNDAQLKRLLQHMNLEPDNPKKAANFSLGMKQRLGLAMAMIGNPQILILDEPTNGLDPTGIVEIRDLIRELNEAYGVTVLISSHLLSELGKLATVYGILKDGKLIKELREEDIALIAKPYIKLTVTDCPLTMSLLKDNGYEALAHSVNTVHVTTDGAHIAEIINLLSSNGVSILSVEQREGDLESEFIGLMGGVPHEKI